MADAFHIPLTLCPDFIPALLAAGANTIHTTPAGVGNGDELWIHLYTSASAETITVASGGVNIQVDLVIPAFTDYTLFAGQPLRNGLALEIVCTVGGIMRVMGWVNRL